MAYEPANNWRNDPGLTSEALYKKRFAIIPVTCSDGNKVWMKSYYSKYEIWTYRSLHLPETFTDPGLHKDFIEHISEEEYIIRKLSENL